MAESSGLASKGGRGARPDLIADRGRQLPREGKGPAGLASLGSLSACGPRATPARIELWRAGAQSPPGRLD